VKDPLEGGPPIDNRRSLGVVFLVLLSLVFLVTVRPSLLVTVVLIVALVATIMLHEFGHFIMAKRAGMKVTEFFIGFGPRLWSFRRGETEYGIKAIPAGGYVRIIGMNNMEEIDPADEPRTYRAASFGKRVAVVSAGIIVNLFLAFVLVFAVLVGQGEPTAPSTSVSHLLRGSPAAKAGFMNGDVLRAVDGHPVRSWNDVPKLVQPYAGKELTFTIERHGRAFDIHATPQPASKTDNHGRVGIVPGWVYESFSVPGAAGESVVVLGRTTKEIGKGLARIFSPSGVQRQVDDVTRSGGATASSTGPDLERPRSVIGIVSVGGQIIGSVWELLFLLGTINLFLALFNLVPLLPFDGGHVAVAVYEAIASRFRGREVRVDFRRLIPVTAAVLALLLMIGLSTMYLDIREIVTGS
jgi:membrane-associated protease RseP (regulator of RpoE activity)